MTYELKFKKKILKKLNKTPIWIQQKFSKLLDDLKLKGPEQPDWYNYSQLNKEEYHCHLSRSWVACWQYREAEIIIEVYYVGSRENAPY